MVKLCQIVNIWSNFRLPDPEKHVSYSLEPIRVHPSWPTSVRSIQLKVTDIGGLWYYKVDRFSIFENRFFSNDISETIGPTKMVLSKFAESHDLSSHTILMLICSLIKSYNEVVYLTLPIQHRCPICLVKWGGGVLI